MELNKKDLAGVIIIFFLLGCLVTMYTMENVLYKVKWNYYRNTIEELNATIEELQHNCTVLQQYNLNLQEIINNLLYVR